VDRERDGFDRGHAAHLVARSAARVASAMT